MTAPQPTGAEGPIDVRGEFAVWAPVPDTVTLHLEQDGTTADLSMRRDAGSWWRVAPSEVAAAGVDLDRAVRYGYRLGDEPDPRPDPRSRRQPDGVHGLSQLDPQRQRTEGSPWHGRPLAGGVVYELHIGTFTPEGTFDAAVARLDHLVELGVDFVEVLPVNDFNGTHNWGYDGVLWYAVHETYGGPDGYRRFVDACHAAGLGVVQDVVYNHLGPSGNYLPLFGPYLHTASSNTWGSSLNLDGEQSDEVRRYVLDNLRLWFAEMGVDGLRLDAVHALVDHRAVHVLEQMATDTAALQAHLGRPLTLIAESDLNDPRLITPQVAGGAGLTAQWSDDYHHVLHVALTGETVGYYADFGRMSDIAKVLTRGFFHDGSWSSFRGRSHGRPVDLLHQPTWSLIGYAQDHDQIGNRATGDRLSATLDADRLAVAAVLVLTAPFTPMLFMGEEWAASTPWQFFTSHPEPELATATAEGRIAEFARMGWDPASVPDPQDPETFERSKLDWDELSGGDHARILQLHRDLIALRRSRPELTDPRFSEISATADDDARWLVVDRGGLQVVVSLADGTVTVPVAPHGGVLLSTVSGGVGDADGVGDAAVTLTGAAAVVLAPR